MTNLREYVRLHKKRSGIVLAGTAVLFVIYFIFYFTVGMRYDDTFFSKKTVNGTTFYTGITGRGQTDISVSPPKNSVTMVTYQLEGFPKKTYFVTLGEPESGTLPYRSVRINRENGEKLFDGTWDNEFLTDENGEIVVDGRIKAVTSMGVQYGDSGAELTATEVTCMALYQYDTIRGKPQFLTPALFILLMTVLDMTFPLLFFSWHHSLWVNDPEPNEFYLAAQKASWIIFPLISLVLFVLALC